MVKFKKLKFKNFLSYGNQFTEIELDRHRSTLIIGHNGAGKSTMLDAISFALFNLPHRSVNKGKLVNSINKKDCVVEVEFEVGSHEFKIVRGLKPHRFEIWQNGKMINQSSSIRDYQKYLEQNILKLNHKSFHQIVVLGSSSFIPFMQLRTKDRREVIEDLLDISIFSKMNNLLREKVSLNNESVRDIEMEILRIEDKIDLQKKYIQDISLINDEQRDSLISQIETTEESITKLTAKNDEINEQIEGKLLPLNTERDKLNKKREQLIGFESQFKQKITTLVKETKFYENNESCPTCSQEISKSIKDDKLKQNIDKAKELSTAMDEVKKELEKVNNEINDIVDEIENIKSLTSEINANNREISSHQHNIKVWNKQLASIDKQNDIVAANTELNKLNDDLITYIDKKGELQDIASYNKVAQELLKDSGIKTKIVKEYIPVINQLVNQYLQILDFFVSFNLNENFEETIKSRHRDDFVYASFSEGEKQRIDLSLMFTWRQISKMKNSTSTNLLILDETFDSSLDEGGIENLFKILETIDEDTNTFIISHKGDILEDKFPNKIEFYKDKNFSMMKGK